MKPLFISLICLFLCTKERAISLDISNQSMYLGHRITLTASTTELTKFFGLECVKLFPSSKEINENETNQKLVTIKRTDKDENWWINLNIYVINDNTSEIREFFVTRNEKTFNLDF